MSEMMQMVQDDAKERMGKSIENLKHEFIKIRTGRAHTSLLDHIKVDYYGSEVPIAQAASVTILDSRTLGVTPFEKAMLATVDKAILNSDLGLNPTNVGNMLRVPLPAMTEERRRDLVKVVRHEAENAKVAVRNIRRDANNEFKKLLKDKDISEDDEHRAEEEIQKLTDGCISKIDDILKEKETELMEV